MYSIRRPRRCSVAAQTLKGGQLDELTLWTRIHDEEARRPSLDRGVGRGSRDRRSTIAKSRQARDERLAYCNERKAFALEGGDALAHGISDRAEPVLHVSRGKASLEGFEPGSTQLCLPRAALPKLLDLLLSSQEFPREKVEVRHHWVRPHDGDVPVGSGGLGKPYDLRDPPQGAYACRVDDYVARPEFPIFGHCARSVVVASRLCEVELGVSDAALIDHLDAVGVAVLGRDASSQDGCHVTKQVRFRVRRGPSQLKERNQNVVRQIDEPRVRLDLVVKSPNDCADSTLLRDRRQPEHEVVQPGRRRVANRGL